MFSTHVPPSLETPITNLDNNSHNHKKLLTLGLDTNNILQTKQNILTYYIIPNTRLAKQKQSLTYLGPLSYNHYCNKLQSSHNMNPEYNSTKYKIHKLTPKPFISHIKKEILAEQSLGEADSWAAQNTPLYLISMKTTLLRSQKS